MQPVALDVGSFADDVIAGRLPPADWPRLARDVGVHALDLPLGWLLDLDPLTAGPALKAEMGRRGVVLAGVREGGLCDLTSITGLCGAPAWTSRWWCACRDLVTGGWGAGLVVLRSPPTDSLGLFNKVGANLERVCMIAQEWGLGVAITNEQTQRYLALVRETGVSLGLDGDLLPADGAERCRAIEDALPHLRLLRLLADGSDQDARVLTAWRNLLKDTRFDGFISVSWHGQGDPYSGVGTAIRLLRGPEEPAPPAPGRTTPPHHRRPC